MSEEGGAHEPAPNKGQQIFCASCGKPALVLLGGSYPACVECEWKHATVEWMQFVKLATMMNHSLAEMDAIVGLGLPSAKLNIPKPPMPPINYNSPTVSISGGTVGVVNLGNAHEIRVNLQSLTEAGAPDIVEALVRLTDAILNANDADGQAKNELLEQIAALTAEAKRQPEDRRAGVVKVLLSGIAQGAGAITSVAGAWTAVEPLLKKLFGFG